MRHPGDGVPFAFRAAVAALTSVRPRGEVVLSTTPAPRRLAPYAFALHATVAPGPAAGGGPGDEEEDEELADGRFVLLHNPESDHGWGGGEFRLVTLARAALEAEVAADPLLPEVAWSWLAEALEHRGLGWAAAGGTVTRASSQSFGALAQRPPRTEVELRASWTPREAPELGGHLLAWCGLLAQCAGLPPENGGAPGVAVFPHRRGPGA
ncbi:DUF3000 domain-containing protein [Streptomyces aidingensis]|uniref:DUF3000 domain-containing protein n=1 Tax=Streptomyces aidingensis TaxID=910347 RepID=A0A1I1ILD2_9ACTN|nr:DUF3000 domain-containing protein [Streptomyces aidingensis]SFC37084.1 Protein of unknown function [Streptomyces aidingensis]